MRRRRRRQRARRAQGPRWSSFAAVLGRWAAARLRCRCAVLRHPSRLVSPQQLLLIRLLLLRLRLLCRSVLLHELNHACKGLCGLPLRHRQRHCQVVPTAPPAASRLRAARLLRLLHALLLLLRLLLLPLCHPPQLLLLPFALPLHRLGGLEHLARGRKETNATAFHNSSRGGQPVLGWKAAVQWLSNQGMH